MDKSGKIITFSYTVLKNEIRLGHLKWTISHVARDAQISRGWVYKYFGADKEDILKNSIRNTVEDFFLMSHDRKYMIREKGTLWAMQDLRKVMNEMPEIMIFYIKYFFSDCEYGQLIRSYENQYMAQLSQQFGLENEFQLSFFRTMIHGLGLSFFFNETQFKNTAEFILGPNFNQWLKQLPNHFEVKPAPHLIYERVEP